jgi:hypothetical protein
MLLKYEIRLNSVEPFGSVLKFHFNERLFLSSYVQIGERNPILPILSHCAEALYRIRARGFM